MEYPKYIKIFFEDEEWCGKLKEDKYISETLFLIDNNSELEVWESGSYPVEDLKESEFNYIKITEKDYKDSIRNDIETAFEEEIKEAYKKIEQLQNERDLILSKW